MSDGVSIFLHPDCKRVFINLFNRSTSNLISSYEGTCTINNKTLCLDEYKQKHIRIQMWRLDIIGISCLKPQRIKSIDLRRSNIAYLPHFMIDAWIHTYPPHPEWMDREQSNKILKLPKYLQMQFWYGSYMLKHSITILFMERTYVCELIKKYHKN